MLLYSVFRLIQNSSNRTQPVCRQSLFFIFDGSFSWGRETLLPRILVFGSGLGEASVHFSVEAGRKVPFIWDGILKSPFASHPPRWMFPYSLPLQWLSINNPIIYKVTNLNSLDVFDVVDIEVFEEG